MTADEFIRQFPVTSLFLFMILSVIRLSWKFLSDGEKFNHRRI